MPSVYDIYEFLNSIAPVEMKADFDNVGLLVGCRDADVSRILVSLDITDDVISEALDIGASLIVAHHPVFFSLRSVTDEHPEGQKVVRLLSGGIAAICMHTNLDASRGGVNDVLAGVAGIQCRESGDDGITSRESGDGGITSRESGDGGAMPLSGDGLSGGGEAFPYGRFGYLKKPCSMPEYLEMLKGALKTDGLRFHSSGREVHKVAVVGGSGGDMLHLALGHGCDTFLTADVKYNVFIQAKEAGINLIDGDHFCTENVVTGVVAEKLRLAFPGVDVFVSERHVQIAKFY